MDLVSIALACFIMYFLLSMRPTFGTPQENPQAQRFLPRPRPGREDWLRYTSDLVSEVAVRLAVRIKRSPLPDMLGTVLDFGVEGYRKVDVMFSLSERIVKLGEWATRTGFHLSSIFATAAIKASVAYQKAPGYTQENVTDVVIPYSENEVPIQAPSYLLRQVHIVRLSPFPGSYPFPVGVSKHTQTDPPRSMLSRIVSHAKQE